jgi:protein-S-isoprenylcysteine O-methyltransferase Ste14
MGPYRHVRHPMYVGVILFVLCCPMVLARIIHDS